MSGITDSAKDSLDKTTQQVGDTAGKATEGADKPEAPRSMPGTSESNMDESNEGEGEMVPAAGRINESGEVIDDDGNPIGKVTDGEASKFNGFIVTQEGDILDDDGGVVGKAEPLDDVASDLNYTTKSGKGDDQQSGGVADTAKSAVGGVASGLGNATKGATGAVGDTAKSATDAAGNATGTKDTTDQVGDAAQGATDTAGDTAEGATGAAGDAAEGAGDTAEGAADTAKGAAGDVGETPEGAADDTAKGAADTAEGAAGDVGEKAEGAADTAEGAAGDAGEKAEGAADVPDDEQAAKEIQEKAKEAPPIDTKDMADQDQDLGSKAGSKADLGSKADGLPEQDLPNIPELSPSVANKIVAMFDGPFTVSDGGKVTDQSGKVLGKLAEGQDIQDLVGKEVRGIDGEGNLLGENDTVIGKVDIAPEGSIAQRIKEEVPEAADRLNALDDAKQAAPVQIPSFSPTVADKVIGMFESPFNIGEDGQVTDKNGKILGKLAEGQDFEHLLNKDIKGIDGRGNLLGDNETVLGKVDLVPEGTVVGRIKDEVPEAAERLDAIDAAKEQAAGAEEQAGEQVEGAEEGANLPDISILNGLKINKAGNVVDDNGNPLGKIKSGELKKLIGKSPDKNGKVWDGQGNVIGEVEVLPEALQNESSPFEDFPDATVDKFGKVIFEGRQVGVVVGDDFQNLIGKKVDADGDILDKNGNTIGRAERAEAEEEEEPEEEAIDYSMLVGKKVNKAGNVVDEKGQVFGHVVQGVLKNLLGKKVGDNGEIFSDAGKVIGKAEPIPEGEREEVSEPSPFEDFPGALVGENGAVMYNDEQVGIVVEGDAKKLKGKAVDADGDILDKAGNQLGRAQRWEAPEEEPEPEIDMSALAGKRINKAGNAVDKHGDIYGRVIEGPLPRLIGKMCDKQGFIRNEGGDVIGKCELVPEAEREGMKEGPFSELQGCTVTKEGKVVTPGGDVVGRLVSGDPKALAGRPVDDDGDILDKNGNQLGQAERWEEPEVEKEINPMSGKKVNREGNVIDQDGEIMGKLTDGDLKNCAGQSIDDGGDVIDSKGNRLGHCSLLAEIPEEEDVSPMAGLRCNREGNVVDSAGDVIGKLTSGELSECAGKPINNDADVVDKKGNKLGHCSLLSEIPEEEDISPMAGLRVNREGNVVDNAGDVIGKLTSGELSECAGLLVDNDANVVDKKGNKMGHCSLLSQIPEKKDVSPMSGRRVNNEGNVVDDNGNLIGKVTSGEVSQCIGKVIDDDGDVVDSKGNRLGHCSLLAEISEEEPEPEPEETEEEREARLQLEQDKQIANRISYCIEQSLEKIKPILRHIEGSIDAEEAKSEEDRDEEKLVDTVRPLIEEGSKILTEANGVIRGLDPDGRIQNQAQGKSATRAATPEEARLAELLKELTGNVTEMIERAKRKLENLPKAKKGINPLWGLLSEPLFQIIAAVGLLLSGVLGLVGKLLNGLGLGGLVNNLLGGLGLNKVLGGLGLGGVVGSLTGKK
ncbi:Uu.00g131610.m01.CDS01 [Anthostomella pinea]|uniref:Uu.00g131610.m01.CDS01 n=1 Tax=Anthostomella pinea TaxID=933095 RepID=A0AAI8VDL8_9PEZI|nr:Uu.00g131610.m01.CDS01 [Anthostomella pinea]